MRSENTSKALDPREAILGLGGVERLQPAWLRGFFLSDSGSLLIPSRNGEGGRQKEKESYFKPYITFETYNFSGGRKQKAFSSPISFAIQQKNCFKKRAIEVGQL